MNLYESIVKETLEESVKLPNLNQLLSEINKYVTAEPVEDEEGITIKVLNGLFKISSDGDITFSADWLPNTSNPFKFQSVDEFIKTLESLSQLFK